MLYVYTSISIEIMGCCLRFQDLETLRLGTSRLQELLLFVCTTEFDYDDRGDLDKRIKG